MEPRANVSRMVSLGRHNDKDEGFLDADFDEISFKYYENVNEVTPEADAIKRSEYEACVQTQTV